MLYFCLDSHGNHTCSALAIHTALLIAGVRLASGIPCLIVEIRLVMPASHKMRPRLSLFGVVFANSTTQTAGSTTHSLAIKLLSPGVVPARRHLQSISLSLPPLGASSHLHGDGELKMAQSHNTVKNVLPIRTAAPHSLSDDSTPCSSKVQQ